MIRTTMCPLYDMALIAKAAFNNPTFVEVDSTTYYDVPVGKLKAVPGWLALLRPPQNAAAE